MRLVWLSHILSSSTPLYGGEEDFRINSHRSIVSGDSCNAAILNLPSHAGTHIDAPYHFLQRGRTLDDYPPDYWIFESPALVSLCVTPGMLITPDDLLKKSLSSAVDILLLKTGFEEKRGHEYYWQNGPGLSSSLAIYLKRQYPQLKAIGIDFISISSLTNREEGRNAHRAFLERDIVLIEDMSLYEIDDTKRLIQIVALPMRFEKADAAPCTVVAWIDES